MSNAIRVPGGMQVAESALDRQISEMRSLLALLGGASATEALKALRTHFPDAPLAARTQVLTERRS